MIDIIENTTAIYSDGIREQFDAIRITKKEVMIGKIIDNMFESFGFIPKYSIKR